MLTKQGECRCVAPLDDRPGAKELLIDPFLAIKKEPSKRELGRPPSQKKFVPDAVAELPGGQALILHSPDYPSSLSSEEAADGATAVKVCRVCLLSQTLNQMDWLRHNHYDRNLPLT